MIKKPTEIQIPIQFLCSRGTIEDILTLTPTGKTLKGKTDAKFLNNSGGCSKARANYGGQNHSLAPDRTQRLAPDDLPAVYLTFRTNGRKVWVCGEGADGAEEKRRRTEEYAASYSS